MDIADAVHEKVFAAERRIAGIRLLVVLSGSLIYPFLMEKSGTLPWLAYAILGVAWLYGLYVYVAQPYRRYPVLLSAYISTVADAFLTMLWLYATGGYHSPFYVAIYVAVVGVAFRFGLRETVFAASVYAGSYVAMVGALEQSGVNFGDLATRVTYIFLAAVLGALMSGEVLVETQSRVELRKKMELARVAEGRVRGVLEGSPDAMLLLDQRRLISMVNTETERVFGYDRAQLIGQPIELLLPEASAMLGAHDDAANGHHASDLSIHGTVELFGVRKDGSRVPVEIRFRSMEDDSFITATLRDITDRRESEEKLRAISHSLSEAQHIAHLGAWDWDIPLDKMTWSDELCRIYGLEPGRFEASYAAFLKRVHPQDRDRFQAQIERAVRTGEPFAFDHRILRPDGTERILHAKGHVTLGDRGKAIRMTGTGQDVTERRLDEQARNKLLEQVREVDRLKEIQAFKTRFINTAAHELATPLTPITLQLHLLRGKDVRLSEAARQNALDILDRNVARLRQLVQDILEAARLQASRLGVKKEHVDVSRVAAEAVESFQAPARHAQIKLTAHLEPGLVVDADPNRLSQVLFNLLTNALKFTPRRGRVTVETRRTPEAAEILVRETGIGLAEDQARKLFQPFSRVHETLVHQGDGTGLGLFISRGIVELHDGSITVESPGPGKGTTFRVVLPLASSPVARKTKGLPPGRVSRRRLAEAPPA